MTDRTYIRIHDDFYDATFAFENEDGTGELLESVSTHPGGRPNWDGAGIVDSHLADDPALVDRVISLLSYLHEQRHIRRREEAPCATCDDRGYTTRRIYAQTSYGVNEVHDGGDGEENLGDFEGMDVLVPCDCPAGRKIP